MAAARSRVINGHKIAAVLQPISDPSSISVSVRRKKSRIVPKVRTSVTMVLDPKTIAWPGRSAVGNVPGRPRRVDVLSDGSREPAGHQGGRLWNLRQTGGADFIRARKGSAFPGH